MFSNPATLCLWVKSCIVELIQSATDDVNNGRFFAYLTRWRLPEEMYFRALYMLFVADEAEIPHIISGEFPNGFANIWKGVNRVVFEDRGTLDAKQRGLNGEEFTAMDTLNENAHASFAAIVTCLSFVRGHQISTVEKHLAHWKTLCKYLDYMENMFKAGKSKSDVLTGVKNLHKNASAWQTKDASATAAETSGMES
jgi:hypothetical protein